jgi:glycosyltransferase 2 family protein
VTTPEPAEPTGPADRSRRTRLISGLVGALIGLGGAAFVTRTLLRERDEVSAALAGARPAWLLVAFLLAAAGLTGIGLAWRTALRMLGGDLPVISALRGYFVGQLGKYLPGGVWAIMGRGEWARREGVPGPVAYKSVLLSMGSTYLAAVLLVALLVPASGLGEGGPGYAAVLLLLPLGFAVVHPRVLGAGLHLLRRVTGRDLDVPIPSWGASAALVARHLPSWIAIGASNLVIAFALGASPDPVDVISATALSWVIGFIALPVPGGIGVREAAFVATAASLPAGIAATVAVAARVMFMTVDGLGAALTSAVTTARSVRSGT